MVYVTEVQVKAMTLYDRPANRLEPGFIGAPARNFLPVQGQGAQRVERLGAETLASLCWPMVLLADTPKA